MKKLFISCPMKDRTEAQIRGTMMQMHNIAEAVFGEELDVIQTYIPDPPSGTNQALWCLAERIKMLSEADYFIGVYDEEKAYRGCAIENQAAKAYGIPALRMLCDAVREEAPEFLEGEGPKLLEVMLEHGTFAYPKTCLGEPIHNQQPYAPKEVYDRLMEL